MVVFAEKRVVMCDEKLSTSLLARNSGEQMRILGSLIEHLQFEVLRFKLEIVIIICLTGRAKSNVNYSAQAFLYLFSHQSIYACLLTIYLELSL